jgi:hypothetical protein
MIMARFIRGDSDRPRTGGHVCDFDASYAELRSAFGPSLPPTSDNKVSTHWEVKDTHTGERFSIYECKSTRLYDRAMPSVRKFRALPSFRWSIGGRSVPHLNVLRAFLDGCIHVRKGLANPGCCGACPRVRTRALGTLHLNEVRKVSESAYMKYLELLAEDCRTEFRLVDGELYARQDDGSWLLWDRHTKAESMDLGWPWKPTQAPT